MHAKPTLRLKLVKLTLGLMLVLLALTGCFIVAVSQSLPSRTDSLVKHNDLLQRAVEAIQAQTETDERLA
ncbi:MAG: hypothetical protein AAGE93_23420, partial [Bacteroidota bacterium]